MRLFELRRVDGIFQEHKEVRLVIMGHTHSPTLIEVPNRLMMGPLADGWEDYKDGDYWIKEKEEVVDAESG